MKRVNSSPPPTWLGPIRKEAVSRQTMCIGCMAQIARLRQQRRTPETTRQILMHELTQTLSREAVSRGDWWCEACKDPEGYTERLRLAQEKARQRCLEAYPVCKACGETLPQAFIDAGRTSHIMRNGLCVPPDKHDAKDLWGDIDPGEEAR